MKPGDTASHNNRECTITVVNHLGCRIVYSDDNSFKIIKRADMHTVVVDGIEAAPIVKNKMLPAPKPVERAPKLSMSNEVAKKIALHGIEEYRRKCSNAGEKHSGAKLTDADVLQMKTLAAQGTHKDDIVKMFCHKVGVRTIEDILGGKRWKHIKVRG